MQCACALQQRGAPASRNPHLAEHGLGLHAHALDAVDNDERAVGDAQRGRDLRRMQALGACAALTTTQPPSAFLMCSAGSMRQPFQ